MTTMFFLVRHAAHELVDRVLCGRMAGVRLGDEGRAQARRVADRLAREPIAALHTSPLDRARETAAPIGERLRLEPEVREALNEIDMGEWSGRSFEDLEGNLRWRSWNGARVVSRPPGGESMLEVQARVVGHLERTRADYPDRAVVLVSHADVIKAALLYGLGMPLDGYRLFDISPASISTLVMGDWGVKVLAMNEVPS
ncbi:MAG: histidine phosphatase family protein [Pseudomonadota bacterium]|nr:histidine phosphatase family protein [Pseudomonadota bacterium]